MKTVVIGGRRMSYTENDRTYMTLVADKMIVKIAGQRGYAGPDTEEFHRRDRLRRDREAGPLSAPRHRFFIHCVIDMGATEHMVRATIGHVWRWRMRFGIGAAIGLLTATSALAQPAQ